MRSSVPSTQIRLVYNSLCAMWFIISVLLHFLVWRVLPCFFNRLCLCCSGTLWMMWSLGGFTWYWNGFLQCHIQTDLTRSVLFHIYICAVSLTQFNQTLFKHRQLKCLQPKVGESHSNMQGTLFTLQHWLCSMSQVLQLQSLQSYQNKAVPAAALLFVHVEGAHSLPVSHLHVIYILCRS